MPNWRGTPAPAPAPAPPPLLLLLPKPPLPNDNALRPLGGSRLLEWRGGAGAGTTALGALPGRDTSKSATLPERPPSASVAPSGVKQSAVVVAGSTARSRGTNEATTGGCEGGGSSRAREEGGSRGPRRWTGWSRAATASSGGPKPRQPPPRPLPPRSGSSAPPRGWKQRSWTMSPACQEREREIMGGAASAAAPAAAASPSSSSSSLLLSLPLPPPLSLSSSSFLLLLLLLLLLLFGGHGASFP